MKEPGVCAPGFFHIHWQLSRDASREGICHDALQVCLGPIRSRRSSRRRIVLPARGPCRRAVLPGRLPLRERGRVHAHLRRLGAWHRRELLPGRHRLERRQGRRRIVRDHPHLPLGRGCRQEQRRARRHEVAPERRRLRRARHPLWRLLLQRGPQCQGGARRGQRRRRRARWQAPELPRLPRLGGRRHGLLRQRLDARPDGDRILQPHLRGRLHPGRLLEPQLASQLPDRPLLRPVDLLARRVGPPRVRQAPAHL